MIDGWNWLISGVFWFNLAVGGSGDTRRPFSYTVYAVVYGAYRQSWNWQKPAPL